MKSRLYFSSCCLFGLLPTISDCVKFFVLGKESFIIMFCKVKGEITGPKVSALNLEIEIFHGRISLLVIELPRALNYDAKL